MGCYNVHVPASMEYHKIVGLYIDQFQNWNCNFACTQEANKPTIKGKSTARDG